MLARALFDIALLTALAGAASAAPASEVKAAAKPVTVTLKKHVLADGAKPRNRARLSRGPRSSNKVARASSEPLSDYYLGTDLQ